MPGAIEKASCKACMAGMFAPKPGHAGPACDMCTPGKYQEKHRATECKACGYGRYTIEEGLSDPFKCQNCSAGRWSDTLEARFSADCQPCAVGKYSTEIGLGIDRDAPQSPPSSDDTDYPLGASGNDSPPPFLPPLRAGTLRKEECTFCPDGWAQKETGQVKCRECPPGMVDRDLHARCGGPGEDPADGYVLQSENTLLVLLTAGLTAALSFVMFVGWRCYMSSDPARRKKFFGRFGSSNGRQNSQLEMLLTEAQRERDLQEADFARQRDSLLNAHIDEQHQQLRGWIVGQHEVAFDEVIGRGAFGEVWRGTWKRNIDVAIKKMYPQIDQDDNESAPASSADASYWEDTGVNSAYASTMSMRPGTCRTTASSRRLAKTTGIGQVAADMLENMEVALMMRLRHPRLVTFLGAGEIVDHIKPSDPNMSVEMKTDGTGTDTARRGIFVLLEYVSGGDLAHRLKDSGGDTVLFPWSARLQCAMDIAEGMAYIHSNGLIHRDLKSMNVLHDHTGRCKIADLGLARKYRGNSDNPLLQRIWEPDQASAASTTENGGTQPPDGPGGKNGDTFATAWSGTSQWMAPEVTQITALVDMRGYATYGKPSDVVSDR